MRRKRRWTSKGQNLVLAAGLVVLGVVVVMTLERFMTRDDGGNRRSDPVYLTDERTAVGRSDQDEQAGAGSSVSAASGGEADPGRTGSRGSGQSRPFSFSSGNSLFAGAPTRGESAIHQQMRDFIASPDIAVRLFGTAAGDFVYHRRHGWMQFRDGEWHVLDPFDLPPTLQELYPQLCQPGVASGGGGGDGDFDRDGWTTALYGKDDS